ncbi:hypothetical protein C9374_009998 [Naegleria lovaniensis]|uniref:Mid2 domain-containing protein n=1 Tax=Naegleria lovaniensis TaxID=51637 RepID=A0AA88GD82_NAELO|nr:uncharacterized protein C9374_009998 [Naegleria lovaniensis]KAG2375375.1 hypothetical protein C9374_009998 [Naegleria lovaniensis]
MKENFIICVSVLIALQCCILLLLSTPANASLSISASKHPLRCDCEALFAPIRILDINNTADCAEWIWLPSYENGTLIPNVNNTSESSPSALNGSVINSTLSHGEIGNLTLNDDTLRETVTKPTTLNGDHESKLGGGAIAGIVIGSIVGLILLVLITLAVIGFAIFKSKYRNAKYFVHDVSGKKSFSDLSAEIMRAAEEDFASQVQFVVSDGEDSDSIPNGDEDEHAHFYNDDEIIVDNNEQFEY